MGAQTEMGRDPEELVQQAIEDLINKAANDGWIGMLTDEQLRKLRDIISIEMTMRRDSNDA